MQNLNTAQKKQILDLFDKGGTFLSSRRFGWCWFLSSTPNNFTIAQGLYSYEIIL